MRRPWDRFACTMATPPPSTMCFVRVSNFAPLADSSVSGPELGSWIADCVGGGYPAES